MKKDFLWMLGILIAMLFASCGSESGNLQKGPGIIVTAIADTSIIVETPLTAPRYACGSGKRLKHDKYLGSDPKLVSVSDTESVFLSDDSLNKIGYIYMPGIEPTVETTEPSFSAPTPISSSWGWLEDFASFLLAILMVGIVVWILWWLFNQRPACQITSIPFTSAAPGAAVNPGLGGNPPTPNSAPKPIPASPGHQEIVNHLKDLMTTMQQTGTTELDYRTHGHELHLKNTSNKPTEKEEKTEDEKSAPSGQRATTEEKKEDKK